VGRLEVWTCK